MSRFPYSCRPLKQSSEIYMTSAQKAKYTGVLLRSPQIAESSIENGLREKIISLKQENNSNVIGLLTQRLSNVEKELSHIKSQLRDANDLLEDKDKELMNLKAKLSIEQKNELVCNAPPKKRNLKADREDDRALSTISSNKRKNLSPRSSIGSYKDQGKMTRRTSSGSNLSQESDESVSSQTNNKQKYSSSENGRRKSREGSRYDKSARDSGSPNMVVVRKGDAKPEYKRVKGGKITEVRAKHEESPTGSNESKISQLEKENQQLVKKVADLEKFIGEYGLMWVGDKAIADSGGSRPGTSSSAHPSNKTTRVKSTIKIKQPDLDNVITVITDLNHNTSGHHIVKSPMGAKFKQCDILELKLFADGMQLESNPFRKYDTPSAEAFFKDLEDGYYPTELKSRHPQGVIFKVVDNRNVPYEATRSKPKAFAGKGERLGGERNGSSTSKESLIFKPQTHKEKGKTVVQKPKTPSERASFVSKKSSKLPKTPPGKGKKMPPVQEDVDISEEPLVSRKSVPNKRKMGSQGPPRIDMPSIPMEINLPPGKDSTRSSMKTSYSHSTPQLVPKRQQSEGIRVFSDQTLYENKEKAPINITNITYNEAPTTCRLRPGEATGYYSATRAQGAAACQCQSSQMKIARSPNEICPAACGQLGIVGVPKTPVMCPCQCGARADLVIYESPPQTQNKPSEHELESIDSLIPEESRPQDVLKEQDFKIDYKYLTREYQQKLDILSKMKIVDQLERLSKVYAFPSIESSRVLPEKTQSPFEFRGRTEYEDNYTRTGLMRMKHVGPFRDDPGKPTGFKHIKINPYEEFEHFTYLGRPKDQVNTKDNNTEKSVTYRPKLVELNKKTSETMISIRLRSDQNNKTFLVHLYPGDSVEKLWTILNMSGENHEMVGQIGNKAVVLLDKSSFEEQNIKDNDVITIKKSPENKLKSLDTSPRSTTSNKSKESKTSPSEGVSRPQTVSPPSIKSNKSSPESKKGGKTSNNNEINKTTVNSKKDKKISPENMKSTKSPFKRKEVLNRPSFSVVFPRLRPRSTGSKSVSPENRKSPKTRYINNLPNVFPKTAKTNLSIKSSSKTSQNKENVPPQLLSSNSVELQEYYLNLEKKENSMDEMFNPLPIIDDLLEKCFSLVGSSILNQPTNPVYISKMPDFQKLLSTSENNLEEQEMTNEYESVRNSFESLENLRYLRMI